MRTASRRRPHPSDRRSTTPLAAIQSLGIDTVSFAWRPAHDAAVWAALDAAVARGALRGRGQPGLRAADLPGCRPGSGWATTEPVGGLLWFFDLTHGLIFCEGRLACAIDGRTDATGLRSPRELCRAVDAVTSAIATMGGIVLAPARARIRRLDIAGDVSFLDPRLGSSLLRVLLEQAGGTKQPYFNGLILGTIEWLHGRKIMFRCYDRGDKTGELPAGELIRFEREWRPKWHARAPDSQPLVVDLLDAHDLGQLWLAEFHEWVAAIDAPLLGPSDAEALVLGRRREGSLSLRTTQTLLGSIRLLEAEGFAAWGARAGDRRVRNNAVGALGEIGVKVVSPPHRRGTSWPSRAFCRPAGSVLWVHEVVELLRSGAADLVTAAAGAAPTEDEFAVLLAVLGAVEEDPTDAADAILLTAIG